ncbi:uncharacterized protein BHQ10_006527 [Talaromyces amestolkiae]|uniref:AA1-like domain-containing protein n=1 Tax=Talaromyces amestolkiae TaxID=1196081 RepID=A0A364L3X2_TALAM|nr:uncharacterized protein BHQ10_006527 [Talaromyces amestolkiae]RAO70515.1 hypothetical protein BHQ10_006527 [Talaromyces amestolkiae]
MFTSKTIIAVLAAIAGLASAAPSKASSSSSSAIPSPSTTPYLTTFYLRNTAITNDSGCVVEVDSYTGCDEVAVLSGTQNCSDIQGTISQPLCGGSSVTADFQGGDRGTHLSYYDENQTLVAYCILPSNPGASAKCATTD